MRQKITTPQQLISILETSVTDSEFFNMPTIGFKSHTKQGYLAKTDKHSTNKAPTDKDQKFAKVHGFNTDEITKVSSGTSLIPLGAKGYKEVIINAFLKHYKETSELPKSMTNAKVMEMLGEDMFADYSPKERKWGKHREGVLNNCVIEHTDKQGVDRKYLVMYFVHGTRNKLKVTHTRNGEDFDIKNPIYADFKAKAKAEENKVAKDILGIDFEFSYRQYDFCNLKYFSCRGNKYDIDIQY